MWRRLSLRPLAAAIESSPRVLLFLFGSKAKLVQELLARAREDELGFLSGVGGGERRERDITSVTPAAPGPASPPRP